MLVLSRKVGERILIGDKIAVTIVRIGQGGARIGIEAPPEMAVVREELLSALGTSTPQGTADSGNVALKTSTAKATKRQTDRKRVVPR